MKKGATYVIKHKSTLLTWRGEYLSSGCNEHAFRMADGVTSNFEKEHFLFIEVGGKDKDSCVKMKKIIRQFPPQDDFVFDDQANIKSGIMYLSEDRQISGIVSERKGKFFINYSDGTEGGKYESLKELLDTIHRYGSGTLFQVM